MMREKNVNNEEHLKYLLRHFAVYFKLPLLKNTSQQYKQTISCISDFSDPKCY